MLNVSMLDIIIIVMFVGAGLVALLFFINKKASKKINEQQELVERSKQLTSMYVIDKKRSKISEVNMPSMVVEQMPKYYKYLKLNFVQAKVGPQIVTLMCDKKVFNAMPLKKNVKVELAGMYIVTLIGMKSDEELKQLKKDKKAKEKQLKAEAKNN